MIGDDQVGNMFQLIFQVISSIERPNRWLLIPVDGPAMLLVRVGHTVNERAP